MFSIFLLFILFCFESGYLYSHVHIHMQKLFDVCDSECNTCWNGFPLLVCTNKSKYLISHLLVFLTHIVCVFVTMSHFVSQTYSLTFSSFFIFSSCGEYYEMDNSNSVEDINLIQQNLFHWLKTFFYTTEGSPTLIRRPHGEHSV